MSARPPAPADLASGAPVMPTGLAHVQALVRALTEGGPSMAGTCERWGRHLAEVLTAGHRLLAVGNGGSAAQAQHLTAELVGRYRDDRVPLSGIALTAETSSLTAIVNDYGADDLFARQVLAHGRPRDVLVVMSTSGRSPNVVNAARAGRRAGLTVWAMTGPAPNPVAELADECLAVEAGSTATVQEVHLVALHLVCASLDVGLGVCPETALDLRAAGVVA